MAIYEMSDIPITPSWHYEHDRLELWDRCQWALNAPPEVTITGPLAGKLVDVLSWVASQSMTRLDPTPEPEMHAVTETDLNRWWDVLSSTRIALSAMADEIDIAKDRMW